MIMTYDFVPMAQRDNILLEKIKHALLSQADEIIYTDIHKLCFSPSKQSLLVEARSENSPFHNKVVPKEIKYSAVIKMLNNNWDEICEDEIIDAWRNREENLKFMVDNNG